MFENLESTRINVSSEEDLLLAAGGDPDKSKGKGGDDKDDKNKDKNQGDKTKGKDKTSGKTDDKSKGKPASTKSVSELSEKDLKLAAGGDDDDDDNGSEEDDDQNDTIEDDDQKDDKNKTKKKDKSKTSSKKKEDEGSKEEDDTNEEEDDNNNEEDDDNNEDDPNKNEEDDNNEDDENTGNLEVKDFLKARVALLIEKGKWYEFEGWEDVEWDEDTFEQIELKQQEAKEADIRDSILDSFGPYGSAIADYASKGGDPEKLIDIFKEQQRVENLSIDSEDDQKAVVLKYVTEFQKMKPKQAQTYINALIADKELADAAKEAKESMETALKEQEEDLQAEQEEAVKQREKKEAADLQRFATDVTTAVNSRTDLGADEKKEILKVLTKFDKKLKSGQKVNDFYFKFAEFKKDLPNYIDFVRFVLDPKKFKKFEKNKGTTEANAKAFNLVRSGNQKKKTKSANTGGNSGAGTGKKSTFKLIY